MPKYEIKLVDDLAEFSRWKTPLGIFEGDTSFDAIKKCRKMYKNLINERSKLECKEVV